MCPAMVNRKTPMLLHDNARPHVEQQKNWKTERVEDWNCASSTILSRPLANRLSFFSSIGSFLVWKIIEEQRQFKTGVPGVPHLSYIGLLSNWNSETCFLLGEMYSIKRKFFWLNKVVYIFKKTVLFWLSKNNPNSKF